MIGRASMSTSGFALHVICRLRIPCGVRNVKDEPSPQRREERLTSGVAAVMAWRAPNCTELLDGGWLCL
jgi:hypothetical protein